MPDEKIIDEKIDEPISLSAALLSPINAIFEAQIHSARAFLNFILQMGFRHKPSPEELANNPQLHENEKERENKKVRITELLKERNEKGTLSKEKIVELKELHTLYGDMYFQSMDFIDNTGNEFLLSIPNLALLPIKPLAISEADFTYEFAVSSQNSKYDQMGAAKPGEGKEKRPWFLVKEPKELKGSFASSQANSSEKSIKINVKVSNTEIPYGLEKLLVHLTNQMETIDTNTTNNQS